jgi:hypothetical protein
LLLLVSTGALLIALKIAWRTLIEIACRAALVAIEAARLVTTTLLLWAVAIEAAWLVVSPLLLRTVTTVWAWLVASPLLLVTVTTVWAWLRASPLLLRTVAVEAAWLVASLLLLWAVAIVWAWRVISWGAILVRIVAWRSLRVVATVVVTLVVEVARTTSVGPGSRVCAAIGRASRLPLVVPVKGSAIVATRLSGRRTCWLITPPVVA